MKARYTLVLLSVFLVLGTAWAGPMDIELRTWRVTTENCTFSAESEFADRSPVYRLAWPADKPGEKGKVELAKGLLRQMLDSWMPPYVGAHAKQIAFSVYRLRGDGKLRLEFDVDGKPVSRHFESSQFRQGAWKDYAFDLGLKPGQALGGVRICFDGAARISNSFSPTRASSWTTSGLPRGRSSVPLLRRTPRGPCSGR